ncbi:MAG TPA: acyl-CoA thioesterase [Candidatus Hydrogenedentes bacterium]|nr:acyl-CoA thioesterase [Candidatus Hydrogenedentota bacterium]
MHTQSAANSIYRHEFIVSQEAIDELDHVNNLEYLRWMLNAAFAHSDAVGCTAATRGAGAAWVVRSHKIEYLRPAFAGETIAVLTWVSNFRKVRSLRKYRVFRVGDRVLLARGETDWVYLDAQSMKLRAIPKEIADLFHVVQEDHEPKTLD